MNAMEKEIQRTIWREQEAEEIEAAMRSALKRSDVQKFLGTFNLSIHAPMQKGGFNEWNYWHCMKGNFPYGLFPISADTPETLGSLTVGETTPFYEALVQRISERRWLNRRRKLTIARLAYLLTLENCVGLQALARSITLGVSV